ncbi:MAG: hypothetical protein ACJ8G2_01795 [Burkholderiales bacterium]
MRVSELRKDDSRAVHSLPDLPLAAKLLPNLNGADPVTALDSLRGRLDDLKATVTRDERARNYNLALLQQAGDAHLSALLARFLGRSADKREADWNALFSYQRTLTAALCGSARLLLHEAIANPSLQLPSAAGAARGLEACRTLAKICLVRYLSVPPKLWQLAYAVHADAEKASCSAALVSLHASQKRSTSVTQELLRLLMLQSSAPDMMAPEQIEVADRVILKLSGDFALLPRNATDGQFYFSPASDRPPCRTGAHPSGTHSDIRYFGAGAGFNTLQQLYKQLATATSADIPSFGKDIAQHVQVSAVQHLLAFWAGVSPYVPPARSKETGTLRVAHRYAAIWQEISRAGGTVELTLAEDGDDPTQVPETWKVLDAGGNELGVEISQQSVDWARCGEIVAVLMPGKDECWLGIIRSMHAEPDFRLLANIAILSRAPQAVQLHVLRGNDEANLYTEETARQFGFNVVRAIILPVDPEISPKLTLLVPPESWKEGRTYETTGDEPARQLRGLRLMRRGDDYVRAMVEWVSHE